MLSPKQIGTICLVFSFVFLSAKSFSENIPSNPTCDNATLGVYSGSAALEPDWGANKIPIRWYNNNTLMTVTNAERECDYDDNITVPTAPSRRGYNFTGWRVRPEMDFATLTNLGDAMGYGKGIESGAEYCGYNDGEWHTGYSLCKEDSIYHDLLLHEWKSVFNTGVLYGMSKCSPTAGLFAESGNPVDIGNATENISCWCKVISWRSNGENQQLYSPSYPLSWVFVYGEGTARSCAYSCAYSCANAVRLSLSVRAALFTPATNNQ